MMNDADLRVRRATYRLFVELGRAPTVDETSNALDAPAADIGAAWHRLHDEHALVLQRSATEIRMANPFSAVPTAYRVNADDRWWYANCAWDAFGICAALGAHGTVESSCADCGEPLTVHVAGQRPIDDELLFHCLVPASAWWDDIVFT